MLNTNDIYNVDTYLHTLDMITNTQLLITVTAWYNPKHISREKGWKSRIDTVSNIELVISFGVECNNKTCYRSIHVLLKSLIEYTCICSPVGNAQVSFDFGHALTY